MNHGVRRRSMLLIVAVLALVLLTLGLGAPVPGAALARQSESEQQTTVDPATVMASQQNMGNRGTEFWLAFPRNAEAVTGVGPLSLSLFLTGDTATSGRVQIAGILDQAFTVTPGAITTVDVPIDAELAEGVENKGIYVTAEQHIIVYGLSQRDASTDAYLALPVPSLGAEYMVASYAASSINPDISQYAVVATQDNTNVTITLPDGSSDTVSLNRGETYQDGLPEDGADVTGTVIASDRPVAVFSGNNCTNIPGAVNFCDHVVEQLPPTASWGQRFATVPLATRSGGDTFRFLAAVDGTEARVNGELVATLNRGQFHEQLMTGVSFVEATQPILVTQYSTSAAFDGTDASDPFMMLIPPVEQFFTAYTVSTPEAGITNNFINIVAPDNAVGDITLDGQAIPESDFTVIGDSGFSGAQVSVAIGTSNLAGPQPFGVFSYGYDVADSYGYPGGQNAALIAGVLVNPINLNLVEGTSGTYEVVLSRQPSSDVTISIQFDTAQVSLDRSSLTFTPDNWNTPQIVTVLTVDDGDGEGEHRTIISQDAESADASYDTVDVANVQVTIANGSLFLPFVSR